MQQKTRELSDKFTTEKGEFVSSSKNKIFIENYSEQKWINATGQDNSDVKERNQSCISFISICSSKISNLYNKHSQLKKNISVSIQKYETEKYKKYDDYAVITADYELFSKNKKEFETQAYLSIDTISKLINSYNETVLKLCNNVERKYVTVSFSGGSYSTNYINKSLYNKQYSIVRDYLFEQLKQASSIEKEQKILSQINSLADKMISLINQDTKELEKQLKKAETPEDKLKIFTL